MGALTDATGHYRLDGLAPGAAVIIVQAGQFRQETPVVIATGQVTDTGTGGPLECLGRTAARLAVTTGNYDRSGDVLQLQAPRVHADAHAAEHGDDGLDGEPRLVRVAGAGFTHHPKLGGIRFALMDYTFERVAGGTRYRNSLTAGRRLPPGLRWITRQVVAHKFDEAHGRAWLLRNVEEVGNLEFFLPALFEGHGRSKRRA